MVLQGAAGIGKTAIAEEIVEHRPFVVGQCLSPLSHIAYHSLSHALRLQFTGDADAVAAQVIASIGARVLWIEDLHWADETTVDVLRRLNGQIPMLVTTRDESGAHIGRDDRAARSAVGPPSAHTRVPDGCTHISTIPPSTASSRLPPAIRCCFAS